MVAKLEVSAAPGDRCGGSKDGVRVEVTSELHGVGLDVLEWVRGCR